MDISRVLTDLLQDKGKVAIPGLGQFNLVYVPAEIYKFTKRVVPPTYKIEFQANENESNETLYSAVARVYNLTEEEASEAIKCWVFELREGIKTGQLIEIKDIGSFLKDNNKIIFTEDKKSVLLAENFGLESAKIPLIELDEPDEGKKNKPKHKKIIFPKYVKISLWIAASIIVLSFCLAELYENGYLDAPLKTLSKIFTIDHSDVPQLATNDTLNGKIDANELKRQALKYNEVSQLENVTKLNHPHEKKLTYYIIAGSFRTEKNAKRFEKKMIFKGFSTKILTVEDTLYRVAVGYSSIRHKAVEEYIAITNKDPNLKIWMYSRAE